ncbi:hypothetical protein [Streptomyces sp. NBC_00059]|nr:hypothetical protein [Streptomyces sp. NBC_00059]MCX5416186.1 hypothetical protein [Streptomyces sp. NBC_00059]
MSGHHTGKRLGRRRAIAVPGGTAAAPSGAAHPSAASTSAASR